MLDSQKLDPYNPSEIESKGDTGIDLMPCISTEKEQEKRKIGY